MARTSTSTGSGGSIGGSIALDQVAFGVGADTIGGADFSINYSLRDLLFRLYDDGANLALQTDGVNHTAQIGGFRSGTGYFVEDDDALSFIVNKTGWSHGANIVSATTLALGDDGNYFHVTGTTQIDNISLSTWRGGMRVVLYFVGAVVLSHNVPGGATKLPMFLATASNTLTVAGARLEFILDKALGSNGAWVEINRTYP